MSQNLHLWNINPYQRNLYLPICSNIMLHVWSKYPANMHIPTELNTLFGSYTCISYKKSYYLYAVPYVLDIHSIRKLFFENENHYQSAGNNMRQTRSHYKKKKTFLILIAKLFKAGIKKESIQYTFYIK